MSGFQTTDGGLDGPGLEMALQELEDGTLDPVRRDELMALVTRSPAAQRAYLQYFEISAMLGAEAATHAEQGNLPKIVSFESSAALVQTFAAGGGGAACRSVPWWRRSSMSPVRRCRNWRWRRRRTPAGRCGVRSTMPETTRPRSVRVPRCGWSPARWNCVSNPVRRWWCKARPMFPFPNSRSRCCTAAGCGSIRELPMREFEVRTPELRIRNLGTRFGVRVPTGEPAEVHLITGKTGSDGGVSAQQELQTRS